MKPKVPRQGEWIRHSGHAPNLPNALWFTHASGMHVFTAVDRYRGGASEFHLSISRATGELVSDEDVAVVCADFRIEGAVEHPLDPEAIAELRARGVEPRARHLYLPIRN